MFLLTEAAFLWKRHFQAKSLSFYSSITISKLFPSSNTIFSVVQPSRELQVEFDFPSMSAGVNPPI